MLLLPHDFSEQVRLSQACRDPGRGWHLLSNYLACSCGCCIGLQPLQTLSVPVKGPDAALAAHQCCINDTDLCTMNLTVHTWQLQNAALLRVPD